MSKNNIDQEVNEVNEKAPMTEKELQRQEKEEWKKQRKIKRGLKALKCRNLKNFFLWFAGVLSAFVMIASAIFITLSVIPLKTLVGDNGGDKVSEEVADLSLLALFTSIGDFTRDYQSVTDAFPIVETAINDALSGAKDYISIDFDKVKDVPFNSPDFGEKLMSGVTIVASIKTFGGKSALGDFGKLPIFENVDSGLTIADVDTSATDFSAKLYNYYDVSTNSFKTASNEDGTAFNSELSSGTRLYYASLETMQFSGLMEVIGQRIGVVKVVDLVESFSAGASNSLIGDILGDLKINEMGSFDGSDVKLSDVIDRYEADGVTETQLFKFLGDVVTATGENGEILLSDLSSFNLNALALDTVLDEDTKLYSIVANCVKGTGKNGEILLSDLENFNEQELELTEFISETSKLYTILVECTTPTGKNGKVTIKDLSGFDMTDLRLSTVIESSSNKIINKLISDDTVTIGNLGDKINTLELSTIFESECFTTDKTKAVQFANANFGRYKKVVDPNEDCERCVDEKCTCEQFVLLGEGETASEIYYINKNAKIWFFMYYCDDDNNDGVINENDFDTDGFAKSYKPMHLTLGNLEEKVAMMSDEIQHATIRQLVSAGLIEPDALFENNGITYVYSKTVNQAIGG